MTRLMLAAVLAMAFLPGLGLDPVEAAQWRDGVDLRISARLLADGRLEFALQQRAGGDWGEHLLPHPRFFPARAAPGQWLVTGTVTLDSALGETEFRITARRLARGSTEAALQSRTAEEWGERRPASGWTLPQDASVGRWYSSGVIAIEAGAPVRYRGSTVDRRLLGEADAPVRIVVFEDFSCSFCRIFGRDIIPILAEEYIRPGVVSLEFRHMAILGVYSQTAAAASECAADQDVFWPYHDILIANPSAPVQDLARTLDATAGGAGLDLEAFDACVDADTHTGAVLAATAGARALLSGMDARVIGVPSFLVNGELWRVGIPSIEELRAEIARVQAAASD